MQIAGRHRTTNMGPHRPRVESGRPARWRGRPVIARVWREGVRRTVAYLEERNKLKDSGTDDYEDRLIAAFREGAERLPKQEV
jgi:hypothetical protein